MISPLFQEILQWVNPQPRETYCIQYGTHKMGSKP
jgi:hypothetical protein